MTTATLERSLSPSAAASTEQGAFDNGRASVRLGFWQECRLQIAGLLICVALLCMVMKPWQANLRVPFDYFGDSVLIQSIVKSVVDNGWYLHNEALGAPGAMDLHDFPMADTVHLFWIVGMRQFTRDSALIFNLFYLLTFPLTTATAIWALRRLGVSSLWALVFGLLYAFQPYHILRATGHYFLSAYYLLPPMVLLIVRIYQGRGPFFGLDATPASAGSRWFVVGAVVIAVVMGGGGVYYAFFGCFFAMVAGFSAAISLRRWSPLVNACLLSAITTISLAVCLSPSFFYWRTHGKNQAAVDRSPAMAEVFGLKMSQLVMPVPFHRITKLRHWSDQLLHTAPMTNENACSVLGLLGSVGFCWLLVRLLVRGRNAVRTDPLEGLTVLNAAAVLLGTMGGFGAMLSWLGVTWIRGYNRISIYIAFFALALLAVAFDRLAARLDSTRRTRLCMAVVAFIVLFVGMFDQVGVSARPPYEQIANVYLADQAYIQEFERRVPAGTMVFELPYQRFVEHYAAPGLACYDMMHPFLHSHQLHWSYGSVDGRPAHAWHKAVSQLPVHEMVAEMREAGFGAIYIDRMGFDDHAVKLESELKAELGTEPFVSQNLRLSIYIVPKKS